MNAQTYLQSHAKTRAQIDAFLKLDYQDAYDAKGLGWTYDTELGWTLVNSIRHDGIEGSKTYYHYEPTDARQRIHAPEKTARIHTYGNSFTHCDQVSDGETWQEYLAAHLREPIENYGVGGYSVYQAYRRMLKVEREHPAEYIVLNIWDDDNFRNLDAWRTLRFGRGSNCGFTLPHLNVDLEHDIVSERENLCPTPDDVHRLAEPEWLVETFADDPVLNAVLDVMALRTVPSTEEVPLGVGLPGEADLLCSQLAQKALRATRHVLELTEAFVNESGKKLLVVLSYSQGGVLRALQDEPNWDQSTVDFLKTRDYPFLDLRQHHLAEFNLFNLDPAAYLTRYYNGHYAPAGNFFFAQALKDIIVDWLDPKPLPYI